MLLLRGFRASYIYVVSRHARDLTKDRLRSRIIQLFFCRQLLKTLNTDTLNLLSCSPHGISQGLTSERAGHESSGFQATEQVLAGYFLVRRLTVGELGRDAFGHFWRELVWGGSGLREVLSGKSHVRDRHWFGVGSHHGLDGKSTFDLSRDSQLQIIVRYINKAYRYQRATFGEEKELEIHVQVKRRTLSKNHRESGHVQDVFHLI